MQVCDIDGPLTDTDDRGSLVCRLSGTPGRGDCFEQRVLVIVENGPVIPEHFSPYKYTAYNIVIQIPPVRSSGRFDAYGPLGLLVTPPLWDTAGAERCSRRGSRKRHGYTRQ